MSTTPGPNAEAIAKLRAIMADDPTKGRSPTGAWDQAWLTGTTPWDNLSVQPALRELIEERWDAVGVPLDSLINSGEGTVVIPGCGRGYDAIYFASLGFKSWGLDLSATAVAAAEALYASTTPHVPNVNFQACDFFASTPTSIKGSPSQFSLAYDYTFLCAIPPELRTDWASTYASLVKPGGLLIALMFPLDGNRPGGPPYSLSEDIYEQYLGSTFERIYYAEVAGTVRKEKMSVWRRK